MVRTLTLITGLPGSGKSTLAGCIVASDFTSQTHHVEADMYFINSDGDYKFDVGLLHEAHEWCYNRVKSLLGTGASVVVSNTFTTYRERAPYISLAERFGVVLQVIECHAEFGSIHNVPQETLDKMARRYTPYRKDGHHGFA